MLSLQERFTSRRRHWNVTASFALLCSVLRETDVQTVSRSVGSRGRKWWCQSGRTARLVRERKTCDNNSGSLESLRDGYHLGVR